MSNFVDGLVRRIQQRPQIGITFHMGPKKSKNFPEHYDHFRVEGHMKERFHEIYPEPVKKFQIFFPRSLAESVFVLQEYRHDDNGVLVGEERCEFWTPGRPVSYHLRDFTNGGQFRPVDEATFKAGVKHCTGKETLRLYFMLQKFIEQRKSGAFSWCQLSTRGKESSVPAILDALMTMQDVVHAYPWEFAIEEPSNKSFKADGRTPETHKFVVLTLQPLIGVDDVKALSGAIENFMAVQPRQALFALMQSRAALPSAGTTQTKALSAGFFDAVGEEETDGIISQPTTAVTRILTSNEELLMKECDDIAALPYLAQVWCKVNGTGVRLPELWADWRAKSDLNLDKAVAFLRLQRDKHAPKVVESEQVQEDLSNTDKLDFIRSYYAPYGGDNNANYTSAAAALQSGDLATFDIYYKQACDQQAQDQEVAA